jgi:hypothetical protein
VFWIRLPSVATPVSWTAPSRATHRVGHEGGGVEDGLGRNDVLVGDGRLEAGGLHIMVVGQGPLHDLGQR